MEFTREELFTIKSTFESMKDVDGLLEDEEEILEKINKELNKKFWVDFSASREIEAISVEEAKAKLIGMLDESYEFVFIESVEEIEDDC